MTYNVLMGTLNPTNSLTHYLLMYVHLTHIIKITYLLTYYVAVTFCMMS